jgi:hypothetical protein
VAITTRDGLVAGLAGTSVYTLQKNSVTSEVAGVQHCLIFAAGFPGAATVPSPGTAGASVDGTSVAGFLPYVNPSSGNKYLNGLVAGSAQANTITLIDLLWWNSGITVTTTTEQSFTSSSIPSRSAVGDANGLGVEAGILVSTDTTNGSAVTNTAYKYTDSDGNTGVTATLQSFPATCRAGSLIPMPLAAGDKGVRKWESVTLGTSYGGGAIHLILFRRITVLNPAAGNFGDRLSFADSGIRLYDGSALTFMQLATGTTVGPTWAFTRLIEG